MRETFRHLFKNFQRFTSLFLKLQLSAIRIEILRFALLERLVPGGFCLIRAVQSFKDIRFGAEIFEPFLILN